MSLVSDKGSGCWVFETFLNIVMVLSLWRVIVRSRKLTDSAGSSISQVNLFLSGPKLFIFASSLANGTSSSTIINASLISRL